MTLNYKQDRLFYDIEAFPHYFCVVVVDEEIETRHVFEDIESLRGYYKRNRKRTWVGYNSVEYMMLQCFGSLC
jgi:hypothetical protein